jgi:hypothetical protein
MLVLTAVSSIKTRWAGSSSPCARIQRRRARATSARCRSAARRFFLKVIFMTLEEPPQRAPTGANAPLARRCKQLLEGGIRLLFNQPQYQCPVFLQPGCAPPGAALAPCCRFHASTATILTARAHRNPEKLRRFVPRRPARNRFDHALAQIHSVGFRHALTPKRRINADRLAHP